MGDTNSTSNERPGGEPDTNQNNSDFFRFQQLQQIFGQEFKHPFDDFDKAMAYLEAFQNYLRAEEISTGHRNGVVPRSVEVEIGNGKNPQLFYDYVNAKATFFIPSSQNESKSNEQNRKLQVLAQVWPALHASAQRIAAEIIFLMTPSGRDNFLKKYSKSNSGEKNDNTSPAR